MHTIWLASYPKSGNTWLRMLIANLSAKDDKPVDINDLPERGGIASAHGPFDHLLLIDSGLLTHDEADALRPRVYEELAVEFDLWPGRRKPAAFEPHAIVVHQFHHRAAGHFSVA